MSDDRSRPLERFLGDDDVSLEVAWADGHHSRYPFRYLRGYCPCAECQGHVAGPMQWQNPEEVSLVGVRLVGSYGITPVWSDGHQTGIYADELLRNICPCPECLDLSPESWGAPLTPLS